MSGNESSLNTVHLDLVMALRMANDAAMPVSHWICLRPIFASMPSEKKVILTKMGRKKER